MRPQPWWTPIGLLAVIGPSMNDQSADPRRESAQLVECARLFPAAQDFVLLSDEVHLAGRQDLTSRTYSSNSSTSRLLILPLLL